MPASPVLPKLVGQRVKRREDPRLIQGRATYVDDIALVGMQHVAFKRSAIAHGKIRKIDTKAAAAMDGVEAVYTGADIAKMRRCQSARLSPRPNIARSPSTSFGSAASRLRSSWHAIVTSRETRLTRSSLITIRCRPWSTSSRR
jgi:carbon-monoxide dehydrogenase large subunit